MEEPSKGGHARANDSQTTQSAEEEKGDDAGKRYASSRTASQWIAESGQNAVFPRNAWSLRPAQIFLSSTNVSCSTPDINEFFAVFTKYAGTFFGWQLVLRCARKRFLKQQFWKFSPINLQTNFVVMFCNFWVYMSMSMYYAQWLVIRREHFLSSIVNLTLFSIHFARFSSWWSPKKGFWLLKTSGPDDTFRLAVALTKIFVFIHAKSPCI